MVVDVYVRRGGGRPLADYKGFTDTVDVVVRKAQHASGWKWVWYNRRRYQLFGGIRTAFFVDLSNPIKR